MKKETIEGWKDGLENLETTGGKIIAILDLAAAERVRNRDNETFRLDQKYREVRAKELDHGMDI
ncbi:MAG: hypothetical protein GF344_05295 [Chitinivibrionales bacterium]|nr:hypothetical protein [Chitinivibrionales bacterium]